MSVTTPITFSGWAEYRDYVSGKAFRSPCSICGDDGLEPINGQQRLGLSKPERRIHNARRISAARLMAGVSRGPRAERDRSALDEMTTA